MTPLFVAEDEEDSDGDIPNGERQRRALIQDSNQQRPSQGGAGVLKNSFAAAFQSILSKRIDEDKTDEPILAKYKRPAKEVTEEQTKENELKQKRLDKEKLRLMGRHIPTAADEEHERELAIIATKGGMTFVPLTFLITLVVQLFNTVSEFQVTQHKEALQAQQEGTSRIALFNSSFS